MSLIEESLGLESALPLAEAVAEHIAAEAVVAEAVLGRCSNNRNSRFAVVDLSELAVLFLDLLAKPDCHSSVQSK